MPRLKELHIYRFRNIDYQRLVFSPDLNLIFGANGSGKTTLLEAIYYLSRAQSFRTSKHYRIVQEGSDTLTLFGRIEDNGVKHRLGVERSPVRREMVLHRNGLRVGSVAELTRLMPVSVIEPGTFDLVDGPPGSRRRFLDWLMFHVEHGYGELWKQAQRAIRQRNHCLKHGIIVPAQFRPWNERVAALGEEITGLRSYGFELFLAELESMLARHDSDWARGLTLAFVRGWDQNRSLFEILSDNPQSEQKAGCTLYGPNRADIHIRCGGMPAAEVLSRGQQRSLVVFMKLAQMRVLSRVAGLKGLCLLDDINSELDAANQGVLAQELLELGCQLFITSIKAPDPEGIWSAMRSGDYRMFHVEHGQFAEQ